MKIPKKNLHLHLICILCTMLYIMMSFQDKILTKIIKLSQSMEKLNQSKLLDHILSRSLSPSLTGLPSKGRPAKSKLFVC